MYDLRFLHGRVYQDGHFVRTNLYVKDGLIACLSTDLFDAETTYDCADNLVLPGLIDPHTHFDLDLGWIRSVDDFHTGSIAAACGGVTTIVDFLDPVATSSEMITAFERRKQQAESSIIDVKFHACLANPTDSLERIVSTMLERKMNTVKLFTTYSDSNRRTYDPDIKRLLELSKTYDFTVLAHIENDDMIVLSKHDSYVDLPDIRSTMSETSEALKLAGFVRDTGGSLYMVHCSSGATLEELIKQYSDILGSKMWIETCPHYVQFDRSVLKREDGYLYTMAPPLRSKAEQQTLIHRIDSINTIGTDHCSFLSTDKNVTKLKDMPLGIGGIEESFRVLHTLFGDKIIDKMSKQVAMVHGLYPQKGTLSVGSDADLFVYHQEPSIIDTYHGASDYSVYDGLAVDGWIKATLSRGTFVYRNQEVNTSHRGQLLHPKGV